jgi:hypothetical protein
MSPGRTNNVALSKEVQLVLGAELRWELSSWAIRVPMALLRLASKTLEPPNARPEAFPSDEPISWCEKGVIDPAGAIIFDKAFRKAWAELEDLDFPVQQDMLARCISQLIATECDPGKLKTKAIILLSRS